VFESDCTFDASINPIAYEDGEAVFIDTEYDTWNMDPVALEKAFELYPDTKLVVLAHLYGTPGKMEEIKAIYEENWKKVSYWSELTYPTRLSRKEIGKICWELTHRHKGFNTEVLKKALQSLTLR
jgi:hypothetical protein